MLKLETERLIIRPLSSDDLLDCHQLNVEIEWIDKSLSNEENLERRRHWLEWTVRNYEQLELLYQPPYGERALVLRSTGQFVGLVGLVPLLSPFAQLPCFGGREGAAFSAEVGLFWALRSSFQGRGLATEGARGLVDFCFEHLNLGRIMACTEYENQASIGVMRRLGMRIEQNPYTNPPWFQMTGILERGTAEL